MGAAARSREEWEAIVSALEASGESVSAFCAPLGINPRTLSWWRWKLRSEPKPEDPPPPAFLPVVVSASSEGARRTVGGVEFALLNGVVVRVTEAMDFNGVASLASALGAMS